MVCWKNWYRSLNRQEREAYAARAKTTTRYIEIQLVARRRIPRPALLRALAEASLGRVSYEEVVNFFLLTGSQKTAA